MSAIRHIHKGTTLRLFPTQECAEGILKWKAVSFEMGFFACDGNFLYDDAGRVPRQFDPDLYDKLMDSE